MKITPVSDALGVRVDGLDLSKPLDEATISELKALWAEHLVLVFSGQELSTAQHAEFAQNFGHLVEHPLTSGIPLPKEGRLPGVRGELREALPVTQRSRTNSWHTDISFMDIPPSFSLMYGVSPIEREDVDDDTCFANCQKAYETLSPGLKQFLERTRAVHSGKGLLTATRGGGRNSSGNFVGSKDGVKFGAENEKELGVPVETLHPCVRVHPESKRPGLYLYKGLRFEGWTKEESRPLVDQLVDHATKEENVYRHKWRKGDLVCWDNRGVLHLGPPSHKFPKDVKRYMVRLAVTPPEESRPSGISEVSPPGLGLERTALLEELKVLDGQSRL